LRALAVLLLLGLAAPSASAAKPPTVAVMPFRDLSGGTRFVGEAIRETVTSDLKQLGSLRVVERSSLDKVLAEQGLQASRQDVDMATVVKLGKVVGASLIVVGAYQKLAPQVRLTARFVKVETSEVIGTAKVDGTTREFLRLQDKITASLLHSAGFPVHAKQVLDGAEHRPELQSLKTLELYGQAVTSENDMQRRAYLSLAVAEDKNFSYAVKDLEELEKRLKQYAATAREVQEKELRTLNEKLQTVTERAQKEEVTAQIVNRLMALQRWHGAQRTARAFLDGVTAGTPLTHNHESIALQLISADRFLRDIEAQLRDSEWYLRSFPGSPSFDGTKREVESIITRKRELEAERAKIPAAVKQLSGDSRWDLCLVALQYLVHNDYAAARRLFDACFKVGTHKPVEYISTLASHAINNGDWKEVRRLLEEWEKLDAQAAAKWQKGYETVTPSDE
jgi:TolB-like protein